MLLIVQRKTPNEVPFFYGLTYEFIPRLLIPRFLDDQKGGPHAANIMLTVNYGLQTLEQTQTTSIGWGLVPEAYANFGYLGVAAVAVLVAVFYAFVANATVGVPMTSLRFVIGLLIMAVAVRADTMALFVTMQFQSVVGVSLAAMVVMRRQRNPFAEEDAGLEGGQRLFRSKQAASSRTRAAAHTSSDNGMPAPGALAGLIEGGGAKMQTIDMQEQVATIKTAMRPAAWMPRALRMRIIAERREQTALADQAAAAASGAATGSGSNQRPRQVAVTYRNYRRFRG